MAAKRKSVVHAILAALLLVHAGLAIHASRRTSVTIDEFAHLPAGLACLKHGAFSLYHHNPPLAKMLAAAATLPDGPVVPEPTAGGEAGAGRGPVGQVEYAQEFERANASRYFDLFRAARLAIVALSVLGGLLVFAWARRLWGDAGGLLAAALWAFDPNLIAHAGLATTDLAATVFLFAAAFAFRHYLDRPGPARAAIAGVVLGLALLTKFTALLLCVVLPALALLRGRVGAGAPGSATPAGAPGRRGASWLLIPALALLVLNLGFGFQGTGRRLGDFAFLSTDLTRPRAGGVPPDSPHLFYRMIYAQRQNRFEGTWLAGLPVPVPEQYLLGFDEQRFESHTGLAGGGYAMYLNGTIRRTGWWWYYLEALALKTPIALWVVAGLAIAGAIRSRARAARIDEAFWILPAAAVLLLMTLQTGIDLGVRYVLPMFPFLFVGLGRAAVAPRRAPARILLAGAVAWLLVGTIRVHPHEIAYFNAFAGGPAGGDRYLIDSNLDWGQDLFELRRWLDAHPQPGGFSLAYFGAVDPRLAGIDYRVPPRDPRFTPEARRVDTDREGLRPGTYAVSVNFVRGLPHRVFTADGVSLPLEQDAYGYFRDLHPVARAGWSIRIYEVTAEDAARVEAAWRLAR